MHARFLYLFDYIYLFITVHDIIGLKLSIDQNKSIKILIQCLHRASNIYWKAHTLNQN